ncbi:GNAT family N-acetyltransferase [Desulfobacula sp.]|uniref:GNAT family N-acetyltransferase n=1 Tax=Desulfobacula sp. TaxID=2593537 RepID=UPI0027144E4E|nr:GNAT family N-acetyltransferase [Desulfobacula sp.]
MNSKNHPLNDKYSIREITDLTEFTELRTVWDNLANKQGSYLPFLCFDWFNLWLEHFLKDNKLLILLLYKEDEVVTIAPFLIREEKFKGINARKIELIGNVYSPIRNFIFANLGNEDKNIYLSYIFNHLFNNFNGWDVIDLNPIAEDDENLSILISLTNESNYNNIEQFCHSNWYVNGINFSGDEYLNQRSKNNRQELRRRKKKLEELGKLEFRVIKNNNEIDKYMDYYYEVYTKSWKKREGIGPTFHRDLAKLAAEKGWLRLGFLFLNNIPIASQLRIVFNEVCFFLKTAYDDEYRKYGTGVILLSKMIKDIIDTDNVREIDFGPGDESYKKSWASQKRDMKRILIFNKTLKGRFLALLETELLPIVRKHKTLSQIKSYMFKPFKTH